MLSRTLIAGTLLASGAFAQFSSFPSPSYFRETFKQVQTKVELKEPVRLKDFVVGERLELSLKDYLALVMSNNTGIQLQMLSVEQPKNAIQRAFDVWDPRFQASFNSQRSTSLPSSVLEGGGGAGTVTSLSQPFSGTYTQTLDTGTQINVNYAAAKLSTSNSFSTFNPSLTSNVRVDFSQPLLQNRGRYVNRLNLMIARSSYRVADYNLRTQLLNLVSGAETAYWNVIQAQKNVEVAENARKASQNNLDYVQRQLDLGAISPLDIYNPKQRVAETELQVSQAKFALTQAEDALRTQIAVDLDPDLRKLPIVLTESVDLPNVDALVYDSEELITKALANRPDVKAVLQTLDRDDLSIQSAQNGLLPNLALTGLYQSQGRGGIFYERNNIFNDQGVPSTIVTSTPGGFGDALSQMFHFNYPVYSLGLRLNLPIRSHAAAANLADALVSKKQDALRLRNTQQTVRLNVQNAITALQGSKEQLKLAKIQQDFAQKNLDAMNEKYKLGAELLPNVITAEVNLSNAQSNVVQQQVAVRRNILNMLTQTGELLEERGIVVQ